MRWEILKLRMQVAALKAKDSIIIGRNQMAVAKNYSDEMVSRMTTDYVANPTRETVDALAAEFGKTTRSVIAKLSREGVYKAQPRTTKSGAPVISKSQYVNALAAHFGVELPTFIKAGKQDLARLTDVLELHVVAK
tara:strand:+ start:1415 stop:1822 length:408 start_codon:yes stop_codon:yes gene_type:complete